MHRKSQGSREHDVISSPRSPIFLIGNDPPISYLIDRFAQLGGYSLVSSPSTPVKDVVCDLKPTAVLFTAVDILETAQPLISSLANCDIPVLVCSSVADEACAFELGADFCLLHPLTFDGFISALAACANQA